MRKRQSCAGCTPDNHSTIEYYPPSTDSQVGWLRFVIVISLLSVASPLGAQWTVAVYLGRSWTLPSDLEIVQPALLNDLTFHDLSFSDDSFRTPIYYGVRAGYFFQKPKFLGLEVEFVHLKVIANPEESVRMTGRWDGQPEDRIVRFGDFVESFSITHGLNLLMANAAFRYGMLGNIGSRPTLSLVGRFGLGPSIPHTESRIGGILRERYEVTGYGLQLGLSSEVRIHSILFLLFEYKFTLTSFDSLSIVNGTAKASFRTHHFIFGMSVQV